MCYNRITKLIHKFGCDLWVVTLESNLIYILGNILLIQLYFLKKKIFKLERDIGYFLDIFIFIVVIYIWKVRLFGNILILETITATKK